MGIISAFNKYKPTTKEWRVVERKKLTQLVKTKDYGKWLKRKYKEQRKKCYYCDVRIDLKIRSTYHIEHRTPIYYGGESKYSNLCLACPSCNITKGTQQLVRNKAYLRRMNERSGKNKIYV